MKDHDTRKYSLMPIFPRRIGTYLYVNLALAVLMAVVIAGRTGLRSGRFHLIDIFLIIFQASLLASIIVVPFAAIEIYLYRQKKGIWYEWRNRTRDPRRDRARKLEERRHWKSEALRVRLFRGGKPRPDNGSRTRLFEKENAADAVSRAALLMTVADNFERSGKREAADRCYEQIIQRFENSPQAQEAGRRLATATNV